MWSYGIDRKLQEEVDRRHCTLPNSHTGSINGKSKCAPSQTWRERRGSAYGIKSSNPWAVSLNAYRTGWCSCCRSGYAGTGVPVGPPAFSSASILLRATPPAWAKSLLESRLPAKLQRGQITDDDHQHLRLVRIRLLGKCWGDYLRLVF